jgi:hypothetical protein
LNVVYGSEDPNGRVDPALDRMQISSLGDEKW